MEMITLITTCPLCGEDTEVSIDYSSYLDWLGGVPAQEAFPELDADERELLISGICPKCWNKTFGEE